MNYVNKKILVLFLSFTYNLYYISKNYAEYTFFTFINIRNVYNITVIEV